MDKVYNQAVVGAMDILGFRQIACNEKLGLNYMDILSNIAHNLAAGDKVYKNDETWEPVGNLYWWAE